VLNEGALTLEDYWVRRSARAWFDAEGGMAALAPAAEAMAGLLGWSPDETETQIEACRAVRARNLAALETA
jgi:glycerol-3-phosphate dehydrogenase